MKKKKAPPGGHTVQMTDSPMESRSHGRTRLHETRIEHAAGGGSIVRHTRRDKHGPVYGSEGVPRVFATKKDLMSHLDSTIPGGVGGTHEPPDDE